MRNNIDQNPVQLAVVVQLLVPAEAAGILFTADPMTGERDRAEISAAWGLGESIVAGLVTPDSLSVNKATGKVVKRTIADKTVMTRRSDGGTRQEPVADTLRRAPALSDSQAAELTRLGLQIEKLYGRPMDIEWTLCDGKLSIVQARPITTLGEMPIEWTRPDPKSTYMRGSVADLMPDPLSPLFATLGIRALMEQMTPMSRRITHTEPVLPDDYYTTINSYAYANANMPARSWWWILSRLLPAYPRMLRDSLQMWRDELRPEYLAALERERGRQLHEPSLGELWRAAQDVVAISMRYVTALLFATMGASAGAEMLLTNVYNKMVKREGDPDAPVLLMGWNNIPVRADKSPFDLAMWCRDRSALAEVVLRISARELVRALKEQQVPSGVDSAEWAELAIRFRRHVEQFGHIVFQLDFAEPLPMDDPAPMLEVVKIYLRGEGTSPHERQRVGEEKRVKTTAEMRSRPRGLRRWAFRLALRWGNRWRKCVRTRWPRSASAIR